MASVAFRRGAPDVRGVAPAIWQPNPTPRCFVWARQDPVRCTQEQRPVVITCSPRAPPQRCDEPLDLPNLLSVGSTVLKSPTSHIASVRMSSASQELAIAQSKFAFQCCAAPMVLADDISTQTPSASTEPTDSALLRKDSFEPNPANDALSLCSELDGYSTEYPSEGSSDSGAAQQISFRRCNACDNIDAQLGCDRERDTGAGVARWLFTETSSNELHGEDESVSMSSLAEDSIPPAEGFCNDLAEAAPICFSCQTQVCCKQAPCFFCKRYFS